MLRANLGLDSSHSVLGRAASADAIVMGELEKKPSTRVDPDADTHVDTGSLVSSNVQVSVNLSLDPLVGEMLGHFRVDSPVGRGGMGAVYRAWDTSLTRVVALKTLLFDAPSARARFLREARAQASIRHPHVVPIHFVGEATVAGKAVSYIAMDLVEGESLSALLRRERTLPERRALDVVDAVASALEAAHEKGLVHRDVKPSNVLVERGGRILLADFGLARAIRAESEPNVEETPSSSKDDPFTSELLTHQGAIVGTPTYLAPEQAAGAAVDHRADMYSIGVTLYELLTGEPPFSASSQSGLLTQHKEQTALAPRLLAPHVRPQVNALVMRLLEKDPNRRFATYAELRAAVAAARAVPWVDAPLTPRAIAAGIDLLLCAVLQGTLALLVGARWGIVTWSAVATGLGLVEAHWGTTPGKRLMGLRTIDRHGGRPAYARSVVRSVIKLAAPIVEALVEQTLRPGLVEKAASVTLFVIWTVGLLLAVGRRRAAFHDRVAGTRVVSSLVAVDK